MESLGVFFRRDLLTDLSYKLSFALQALHILLGIAAYYFLARLLGESTPDGYAPFPFLLVGMAVNGYMTTALVCFTQAVKGHQVTGTLKSVLATRTSPVTFIVLSSLYPFARGTVDGLIYLLGGGAFGLPLGQVNLPATLLLFGVSLLAFGSIGILSATFTLIFKRGDPLLWLFVSLSWLLGGVFYPREVLPPVPSTTGPAPANHLRHRCDAGRVARGVDRRRDLPPNPGAGPFCLRRGPGQPRRVSPWRAAGAGDRHLEPLLGPVTAHLFRDGP